jgi:putative transposase
MAAMTAMTTEPPPMPYNPDAHHRRSIRLQDYDYSQAGVYFITICAAVRQPWFGDVDGAEMRLNVAGQMVSVEWQNLPTRFAQIALDIFIVMPDHLHGVLHIIDGSAPAPRDDQQRHGTAPRSLGRMMQAFKSLTTHAYIQGVKEHSWPPFFGKLWQRNYYERVIRNETELQHTCEYIVQNPLRWNTAV